jgi:hypothetical protein
VVANPKCQLIRWRQDTIRCFLSRRNACPSVEPTQHMPGIHFGVASALTSNIPVRDVSMLLESEVQFGRAADRLPPPKYLTASDKSWQAAGQVTPVGRKARAGRSKKPRPGNSRAQGER